MSSTTPERTSSSNRAAGPAEDPKPTDPGRTKAFSPFGVTPASSSAAWEDPEDVGPVRQRHVVDRFDGALALLLLRLVTAVILGIRGLQKVQHLDVTRQQFTELGLPYADAMAVVVGVGQFAIAWLLVLGIAVRVAGLGVAVLAIGALAYGSWRTGDFFTTGMPGFNGELKLLLAGVGIAFLGLGGGGWTVDRRFRRR